MATLHEDLHKFLCTWASISLICKSVSVLALYMCTVPIRLDFNDTARIRSKHILPREPNL
jgi:hypothetical protein